MTTEEIVSLTANNIGDIGFEFLTKKEYLAAFNDTMLEIVKKCGTFYENQTVTPTVGSNQYTFTTKDIVKIIRLEYVPNGSIPVSCREVAFSRVLDRNNFTGGSVIPTSDSVKYYNGDGEVVLEVPAETGRDGAIKANWYATKVNDGQFTLYFGFDFREGDGINIWYHKQWVPHSSFDNTEISWDGYKECLLEGMRWRVLRIMMYRPNAQQKQLWEYQKEYQISMDLYYKQLLPEIKRYIWDLKTVQDAVRIAPFRYP